MRRLAERRVAGVGGLGLVAALAGVAIRHMQGWDTAGAAEPAALEGESGESRAAAAPDAGDAARPIRNQRAASALRG